MALEVLAFIRFVVLSLWSASPFSPIVGTLPTCTFPFVHGSVNPTWCTPSTWATSLTEVPTATTYMPVRVETQLSTLLLALVFAVLAVLGLTLASMFLSEVAHLAVALVQFAFSTIGGILMSLTSFIFSVRIPCISLSLAGTNWLVTGPSASAFQPSRPPCRQNQQNRFDEEPNQGNGTTRAHRRTVS